MTSDSLDDLRERLRAFATARDWEQFHDPKNLVMALTAETGELIEHFQWLTPEDSRTVMDDEDTAERIRDELADVAIYLVRLADVLGVDLLEAAARKIDRNEDRYPAPRVRGRSDVEPRPDAAP